MTLSIDVLTIDATDPAALGRWWAEVLGWVITEEDEDSLLIAPGAGDGPPSAGGGILFFEVPDAKTVKNRLHLDLRPDDQDAEVSRLEALGAVRTDIGQGDVTWVVLADPEGNEFCILQRRVVE